MKVECRLKDLKRRVSGDSAVNSVSLYGEIRDGEERLCSVNVNMNNLSDAGVKELEKRLGIGEIEAAVVSGFPISVELESMQKTLGNL